MSAPWASSPGAGPEEGGLQAAIHLEKKEGGQLHRHVPRLVKAFLTCDKTGTGSWVTVVRAESDILDHLIQPAHLAGKGPRDIK